MDACSTSRVRPELLNEFSWSKSRHEKFEECLRAYYFHYYASWKGWEALQGSPVRELYVLKKLSSRWQWAGSVVHCAIKETLERARRTGKFRSADELVERTHRRARWQWAISREKSYWHESSRITGLVEHEYAEAIAGEEWKRLWDQVIVGSLRAFCASETYAAIQRTPRDKWLTVDELDSWSFEGTKVWVAIDFAYADEAGVIHVLDWKTGQQREVDHTQVGIYALYAQQKWGVGADKVLGGLVYLSSLSAERVSVSADEVAVEGCKDEMRRSIAAMQERLDEPSANRASLERFPVLPDRARCTRCVFRRPCGRL